MNKPSYDNIYLMDDMAQVFSLKRLFTPLTTFKVIHLLFIVGFVVYGNSLFNGFAGDDTSVIVDNPLIHSVNNIPRFFTGSTFFNPSSGQLEGVYYRPITSTVLSVLVSFFGPTPFFIHFIQLLLYIFTSCLVYLLMKRFFKPAVSIFLALIFLVHPINSELAVYISDFQDVLFLLFGMTALLIAVYSPRRQNLFFIYFFLLLSLLSKETGALFFALLLIYKFVYRQRDVLLHLGISISIALSYLVLRLFVVPINSAHPVIDVPIARASFYEVLINIPSIMFYYINLFIFPKDITLINTSIVKQVNFGDFYVPLFYDLIALSLFVLLLCFSYIKRKHFRLVLFSGTWFLIGMIFHLHIFYRLDFTVANRWFSFALIGLLFLLGATINHVYRRLSLHASLALIVMVVLVSSLAVRTIIRNMDWVDSLTLYGRDLMIRDDPVLETLYGFLLYRNGEFAKGKYYLERSVRLDPQGARNWLNLGYAYEQEGKIDKALYSYSRSMHNGTNVTAYENYAMNLLLHRTASDTIIFTKNALKEFPNNARLWVILALAYHKDGRASDALRAMFKAQELLPTAANRYIYTRIQQNLPIEIKPIKTSSGVGIGICPPVCE